MNTRDLWEISKIIVLWINISFFVQAALIVFLAYLNSATLAFSYLEFFQCKLLPHAAGNKVKEKEMWVTPFTLLLVIWSLVNVKNIDTHSFKVHAPFRGYKCTSQTWSLNDRRPLGNKVFPKIRCRVYTPIRGRAATITAVLCDRRLPK